jgi:hypothetical protein
MLTAALIVVTGVAGASTLLGGDTTGLARVLFSVVVAVHLVIGTLIIERQPGDRVGRVVYLLGVLVGYNLVDDVFIRRKALRPTMVGLWLRRAERGLR